MPDAPDFYNYRRNSDKRVLGDLAELAVRLGSIVRYDRAGTVVFAGDMESGLAPFTTLFGSAGAALTLTSDCALTGSQSAKLTCPTATTNHVGIGKYLAVQGDSRMGLEASFSFWTDPSFIELQTTRISNGEYQKWGVKWDIQSGQFSIWNSAGGYTEIDFLLIPAINKHVFHTMKLVFDPPTVDYVRLMIDDWVINLSDYVGQSGSTGSRPYLLNMFYANGIAGENNVLSVDDMIITVDED